MGNVSLICFLEFSNQMLLAKVEGELYDVFKTLPHVKGAYMSSLIKIGPLTTESVGSISLF